MRLAVRGEKGSGILKTSLRNCQTEKDLREMLLLLGHLRSEYGSNRRFPLRTLDRFIKASQALLYYGKSNAKLRKIFGKSHPLLRRRTVR